MPSKKEVPTANETTKSKPIMFVRIVEHPVPPADTLKGYQPEVIWVDEDRVVKRQLAGKPNLFEYAFSMAGDLIDPRNESLPDEF